MQKFVERAGKVIAVIGVTVALLALGALVAQKYPLLQDKAASIVIFGCWLLFSGGLIVTFGRLIRSRGMADWEV